MKFRFLLIDLYLSDLLHVLWLIQIIFAIM